MLDGEFYACMFCGAVIETEGESSWLSQYRALYDGDDHFDNFRMSGICDRAIDDDIPMDFDSNVEDIPELERREISLFQHDFPSPIKGPSWNPKDPTRPHPGILWGFPAHVACWNILDEIFFPAKVDVHVLALLCRSAPITVSYFLELDIDYGGSVKYSDNHGQNFPFLERYPPPIPGETRRVNYYLLCNEMQSSRSTDTLKFLADPSAIQSPANRSPTPLLYPNNAPNSSEQNHNKFAAKSRDCFAGLPAEILDLILCLLPSPDVMSLTLASSTFASFGRSEQFWASRFALDMEFGCLSPFIDPRDRTYSWKDIYLQAKAMETSPHYQNRKRIWKALVQLHDIIETMSTTMLHGLPLKSYFEPQGDDDVLSWKICKADIKQHDEKFHIRTCASLFVRKIIVPVHNRRVFVTIIRLFDVNFISGLRFAPSLGSGHDISIGYTKPAREVCLASDLHTYESILAGFSLAIDPRGVRGIGLLAEHDSPSKFAGDVFGIPLMYLRANSEQEEVAIRCEFDGFKMLSIAFSDDTCSPNRGTRIRGTHKYRDDFLWFPEIPRDDLYLGEPHPSKTSKRIGFFQPLTTCMFGGSRGDLLPHLVGLTVWLINDYTIKGIDFHYDIDVEGGHEPSTLTLGQAWPLTHTESQYKEYQEIFGKSERHFFRLDGPRGERISGISLFLRLSVLCIKIRTNRKRKATFPPNPDSWLVGPLVPIVVQKSTKILGLYAELV